MLVVNPNNVLLKYTLYPKSPYDESVLPGLTAFHDSLTLPLEYVAVKPVGVAKLLVSALPVG